MAWVESVFAEQLVRVGLLVSVFRFVAAVAGLLPLRRRRPAEVARELDIRTEFGNRRKNTYASCGGSRLQPWVAPHHSLTLKFLMATSHKEHLLLFPGLLLILHAAEFSWCKFRHLLILPMCIMNVGCLSLIH